MPLLQRLGVAKRKEVNKEILPSTMLGRISQLVGFDDERICSSTTVAAVAAHAVVAGGQVDADLTAAVVRPAQDLVLVAGDQRGLRHPLCQLQVDFVEEGL